MTPEVRVAELGLDIPATFRPAGTYVNAVRSGNLLFLAGHVPYRADGSLVIGKLGAGMDIAEGKDAARLAALGVLATLREELGTLDRVVRIVNLNGLVNATPEFVAHTLVINGASDLLVEVFGHAGQHARLAVGVSSLPAGMALEIQVTVEIKT
jgi:enamine deaminase RidA (YjgF/YER057c/UK114 family)